MFKIAIDAGHGLKTAGKRIPKALDPNQTREWTLNDRIADKVEALLQDYDGYQLLRADDTTGKKDVSLSARVKAANSFDADIYLSLHHNAGIKGGKGGGIVAYIAKTASAESEQWQKALYDELIAATGLKGNRASPLVKKNFAVVKNTTMPAVLLELGFMDSATDVPVILSEAYADQAAGAIVRVLVSRGKLTVKAEKTEVCNVELPVLKKGSKLPAVKSMQILLMGHGFEMVSGGKTYDADGSFGGATDNALRAFQKAKGLSVDGSCGPKTWSALLGV